MQIFLVNTHVSWSQTTRILLNILPTNYHTIYIHVHVYDYIYVEAVQLTLK